MRDVGWARLNGDQRGDGSVTGTALLQVVAACARAVSLSFFYLCL